MSDALQNLLGRLGVTADGSGNITLTGVTASGAVSVGSLTVAGQPIGTEAATALNTVSNGTVTAAIIATSRNCIRGGAQSGTAFTDTTDTAALIVAAYTGAKVAESFKFTYVNNTNATATLVGGTGVNSAGTIAVIPAFSQVQFLVVFTSLTAVTFSVLLDGSLSILPPEAAGTLATNGAGTLTAALLVGREVNRTTVAAAFTDTTDTAALIFAAYPNAVAGESFEFTYNNTTKVTCTLAGGTGVNSAGTICLIPAGATARLLIVLTSATVVTITVLSITNVAVVQEAIGTLTTAGAGTILGATIAGGYLTRTGPTTAFADTCDTVANIIAAIPNAFIGQSFTWVYANNSAHDATLTNSSGITFSGITVVPANNAVTFLVTYTAASTLTFVAISSLSSVTQYVPITVTGTATSAISTTTLKNVTGLTVPVATSGTYAFRAYLPSVSTANGGIKLAVANSGSTTSGTYTGQQWNGTTQNARTTTTTIGNAVAAATTATTDCSLEGQIIVNAGGNLTAQFAQNASHSDTTTILAGATFTVTRIS